MSGTAKKILIVEDDPDIILTLAAILEDEGYVVAMTDNGGHLMTDRFASDPPALIVLDMLLSGWDGREIARHLKTQEATRHIPILMLSAHLQAEREAKAAGADDFLSKPFELDALLAMIATLLE